jgi:hypothetical protein
MSNVVIHVNLTDTLSKLTEGDVESSTAKKECIYNSPRPGQLRAERVEPSMNRRYPRVSMH